MSSSPDSFLDAPVLGGLPASTSDAETLLDTPSGRTRRIPWVPVLVVVAIIVGGTAWYNRTTAGPTQAFRTDVVQRGDVTSSVTATGTLNAVTQIEVGTQVSGQVSAIYADFNDHVTAGQLIARIDPTLLEQAVSDAEAGVERSQAALLRAQREYDRSQQLYERKVLTESEFNDAEYGRSVASADAKSAQVSLDRAKKNLSYTRIYAPIDGVVVERNVDAGQTVAANFSAPQLFLIAQDLGEMEILAAVDESDIGEIQTGQSVTFTVQAYADTTFSGTVRQVRLQSTSTENVVNYTAVVQVANPTGRLLPGMTATVSFLTGSAEDALLVPNAALRYQPSDAVIATAGVTPSATEALGGGPPASTARGAARSSGQQHGTLWVLDENGRLNALRVTVGVSNGRLTQVSGDELSPGLRVIIGTGTASSSTSDASSPFQNTTQSGRPGPGF